MKKKTLDIIDKIILVVVALLVIVFILYPFIAVFLTSFFEGGKFDLSYFKWMGGEIRLVKNSLTVGILVTLLSTFFSLLIAIFWYMQGSKAKKIIMAILMLTIISPPFVTSLSYITLFGRRGFITHDILGLNVMPYGLLGIVLMESLGFTSMNAILLIGFLGNLDRGIIDSARSLGARTGDIIKDVIIPLLRPAITVVMLLTFIRSLADFSTPTIIGGSYNVLATEAYLSVIAQGNMRKAATISVVLFIPAILVFILYAKQFKQANTRATGDVGSNPHLERKGGIYRFIQIGAVFFMVWILLQYGSIFMSAITDKYKGKLYFTLDNIKETIPYISNTFTRSIIYSLIAGVVGSILGLILEYYAFVRGSKFMKVIDFIATMPYIVPGTFFGIGYILAFNKAPLKLTGTAIIVILNVIFKQLPFASKVSYSTITQISTDTMNSVKDLGGHDMYVLKDVVFPLSKSGLYISFVNSFTSTMTTIGSIIFLVYPSRKLATLVMFDVIESGKYNIGSVIACMLILICLFVNGLYYFMLGRKERKEARLNVSRS